jgi:hypothetical protein
MQPHTPLFNTSLKKCQAHFYTLALEMCLFYFLRAHFFKSRIFIYMQSKSLLLPLHKKSFLFIALNKVLPWNFGLKLVSFVLMNFMLKLLIRPLSEHKDPQHSASMLNKCQLKPHYSNQKLRFQVSRGVTKLKINVDPVNLNNVKVENKLSVWD